jgi:molecular chaperone GrpE
VTDHVADGSAGSTGGVPAEPGKTQHKGERPGVVIRDKRRIDPGGTAAKAPGTDEAPASQPGADQQGAGESGAGTPTAESRPTGPEPVEVAEEAARAAAEAAAQTAIDAEVIAQIAEQEAAGEPAGVADTAAEAGAAPVGEAAEPAVELVAELVAEAVEELAGESDLIAEPIADVVAEPAVTPLAAEVGALRVELDERTRDLQRVSAEYANYRKRVDRDRGVAAEQTTGLVLAALLPVLDDLDRAREHGDLVGPFSAVAEQLNAALTKFGLTPFGEKGDPFDPTRHEAVAHLTSAEVSESTCVDVLRRGYLLGERLLRAALVAVADPE